jgi:unsaturated rhamnogalacturonyl hydrolase
LEAELIARAKMALLAMQRYAWEQGVAAQAFLEMGDQELTILMAKEAAHRQVEDGQLAIVGMNDETTDPSANGEAVLLAWKLTGDPALKTAADRQLDYLLRRAPRAANGTLLHISDLRRPWVMSDASYMAPPFLAVAGEYDEAVFQIETLRERLYDPKIGLYRHIWDEGKMVWQRSAPWGGGNGWVAAGIARLLRTVPEQRRELRGKLAGYGREIVDGILHYQRPDGLFYDVVDDPGSFIETNLAQMLAYAIYRGLVNGWLDESYRAPADRMRAAANAKVDRFGLVQDAAASPSFDRPGVSPEAQAFCLLMETAAQAAA